MTSAEARLLGCRILVCRPEPRASALCAVLRQHGADARALPLIEIAPLPETASTRRLIQDFDLFGHVIVASPIAAEHLLARLDGWWPQRPVGQTWYAIGPGTARCLADAGIESLTADAGHDSESLLRRPELQRLDRQRVLLCSGEGGRTLLADSLSARGARVEKLALYQRRRPRYSTVQMTAALTDFDPQAIVALSGETLNNLLALGQNADTGLFQRCLVLPTDRVADHARAAGFKRTLVAPGMDNATLALLLEQVC